MIWLSGLGGYVLKDPSFFFLNSCAISFDFCSIQPVGQQILSGLQIAGHTWNLWKGPNANWEVLSFVIADPETPPEVRNFNADLNAFFRRLYEVFLFYFANTFIEYLIQEQGVASTQVCLTHFLCGISY